jgi:hypothetical protein
MNTHAHTHLHNPSTQKHTSMHIHAHSHTHNNNIRQPEATQTLAQGPPSDSVACTAVDQDTTLLPQHYCYNKAAARLLCLTHQACVRSAAHLAVEQVTNISNIIYTLLVLIVLGGSNYSAFMTNLATSLLLLVCICMQLSFQNGTLGLALPLPATFLGLV